MKRFYVVQFGDDTAKQIASEFDVSMPLKDNLDKATDAAFERGLIKIRYRLDNFGLRYQERPIADIEDLFHIVDHSNAVVKLCTRETPIRVSLTFASDQKTNGARTVCVHPGRKLLPELMESEIFREIQEHTWRGRKVDDPKIYRFSRRRFPRWSIPTRNVPPDRDGWSSGIRSGTSIRLKPRFWWTSRKGLFLPLPFNISHLAVLLACIAGITALMILYNRVNYTITFVAHSEGYVIVWPSKDYVAGSDGVADPLIPIDGSSAYQLEKKNLKRGSHIVETYFENTPIERFTIDVGLLRGRRVNLAGKRAGGDGTLVKFKRYKDLRSIKNPDLNAYCFTGDAYDEEFELKINGFPVRTTDPENDEYVAELPEGEYAIDFGVEAEGFQIQQITKPPTGSLGARIEIAPNEATSEALYYCVRW